MKNIILRNRYTLLLTTLTAYMAVLVAEGAITGREARIVDFENPFFDLSVNNFEQFRESRNDAGDDRRAERQGDRRIDEDDDG